MTQPVNDFRDLRLSSVILAKFSAGGRLDRSTTSSWPDIKSTDDVAGLSTLQPGSLRIDTVLAKLYVADTSGVPKAVSTAAELASTANGDGAALVGVEDSDAFYTGTTVEAALAELGQDRVYRAQVTIATGDVASMNATPVQLVAAPGAGTYIEVVSIHWFLDFASSAYDAAASGDTLVARYTDGSGAIVVDAVAGDAIGAASADYHTVVRPVAEVIPVENAALVAHITTGEWGTGDSPLKADVLYRVREFTF